MRAPLASTSFCRTSARQTTSPHDVFKHSREEHQPRDGSEGVEKLCVPENRQALDAPEASAARRDEADISNTTSRWSLNSARRTLRIQFTASDTDAALSKFARTYSGMNLTSLNLRPKLLATRGTVK
jgi:hypothetical protein